MKQRKRWPHHGCYARLAYSETCHGIGVFAIRNIPKGTMVFADDRAPYRRVPAALAKKLRTELRYLYEDFCVLEGSWYYCPRSFNLLTVSWYVNHSERPNVYLDPSRSWQWIALRRISKGEELTADYRTYSDDQLPWLRRRKASVLAARGGRKREK